MTSHPTSDLKPCCGNCAKQRRGPCGKECRALPPGPDGQYPWANDISWCAQHEWKAGE